VFLTFSHIEIVSLLRRRSQAVALSAVLKYFIHPMVNLWNWSPVWTVANVLDSLREALAAIERSPDLSARLLDAFRPPPTTTMPEIGRILFVNGVQFRLTRVDVVLMCNVAAAFKSPNPRVKRGSLTTAFVIRTAVAHFPASPLTLPNSTA
jgi:hypothetical protein